MPNLGGIRIAEFSLEAVSASLIWVSSLTMSRNSLRDLRVKRIR